MLTGTMGGMREVLSTPPPPPPQEKTGSIHDKGGIYLGAKGLAAGVGRRATATSTWILLNSYRTYAMYIYIYTLHSWQLRWTYATYIYIYIYTRYIRGNCAGHMSRIRYKQSHCTRTYATYMLHAEFTPFYNVIF